MLDGIVVAYVASNIVQVFQKRVQMETFIKDIESTDKNVFQKHGVERFHSTEREREREREREGGLLHIPPTNYHLLAVQQEPH